MILGEEQQEALELIKNFISSKELAISITGFAGTGKSFLTKYIIDYLESNHKNFILCAPTHAAKVVLENFTEREGMTLHKLLSLSPNVEIMELDFKDLQFIIRSGLKLFPSKGIIICDEASMIPDNLFNLLLEKCKDRNSKVIFIGDEKQIRPVNSDTISKVFSLPNKISLNKIYRQSNDSALNNILPVLRERTIDNFETDIKENGSVFSYDILVDFVREALPIYREAIKNSDILEVKTLAYTNNRVSAYNYNLKRLLFESENEYNKSEFLTGCENLEFNGTKFWNSLDYIITNDPIKTDIHIPNFGYLPAYNLRLFNPSTKNIDSVCILSREITKDYFNFLSKTIEEIRLDAVRLKNARKSSGKAWSEYYLMIGSFTSPIDLYYDNRLIRKRSFDYGYATTTHKSQGKSLNNVFIDMKDIDICRDIKEKQQLQYVAVSRARKNVYILQ